MEDSGRLKELKEKWLRISTSAILLGSVLKHISLVHFNQLFESDRDFLIANSEGILRNNGERDFERICYRQLFHRVNSIAIS